MYSSVLGTRRIDVTLHGSADGTANNWTVTRTYENAGDLRREVANARVWGGLHYRNSTAAGLRIADKVTGWALQRFFQPVRGTDAHRELPEGSMR